MTSWAARAKVHFAQEAKEATPQTPERLVVGVLGGHVGHPCEELHFHELATNDPPGLASDGFSNLIASNEVDDSDFVSWPHGTEMNGDEIDDFTARLVRFTDKGVSHGDAERLADKLVIRDREQDDRRLCLECTHLSGYGASSWRCGNWQRAGVAIRARDAQLPVDLVQQLQRCDGLTHAFNPTHTARTHP